MNITLTFIIIAFAIIIIRGIMLGRVSAFCIFTYTFFRYRKHYKYYSTIFDKMIGHYSVIMTQSEGIEWDRRMFQLACKCIREEYRKLKRAKII